MALKLCVKCNNRAHKILDGRLYCKDCVTEMEMPKKIKRPCDCGCKTIVEEKSKKKSWWKKLFENISEAHYM
jgi:hypothetical protein